jgi:hypothetical protein
MGNVTPLVDRLDHDEGVDNSRDQHSKQDKHEQWPDEARNACGSREQKSKQEVPHKVMLLIELLGP